MRLITLFALPGSLTNMKREVPRRPNALLLTIVFLVAASGPVVVVFSVLAMGCAVLVDAALSLWAAFQFFCSFKSLTRNELVKNETGTIQRSREERECKEE